ncbi:MAG TPA: DUF3426 domain-containing protein, partial [Nitrosospira sp.]|nr:DUF3426 domain-containing protein [Nitrosospira sp.]
TQVFDGFATLTTISDSEALDLAKAEAGLENSSPEVPANAAVPDQVGSPALEVRPAAGQADLPETPVLEKAEDKANPELGAQGAEPGARETREVGGPARENEGRKIGDKRGNRRGAAASNGLSFRDGDRLEPELGRLMPDEVMETYLSDKYPYQTARPAQTSLGWAIGNLFLLIVLAAQIIYWYRVDLAVIAPATRPFLEEYCKFLDCTVSLPAQEQRACVASEKNEAERQTSGNISFQVAMPKETTFSQVFALFQPNSTDNARPLRASCSFSPTANLSENSRQRGDRLVMRQAQAPLV